MKLQIKIISLCFILAALFTANFSHAALVTCSVNCTIPDLIQTVVRIINFLLAWAWLIAIFFVAWAAYGFISSTGNEEAIATAKGTFSNAITGFFLIMAMFILINWFAAAFTGGNLLDPLSLENILKIILP